MQSELRGEQFGLGHFKGLTTLTEPAKQQWLGDAITPKLRDELFSNERLEARIARIIARQAAGGDPESEETASERHIVGLLMGADLGLLTRRAGLAWHADQFLSPETVGRVLKSSPEITIDDIRFALRLQWKGSNTFERTENLADEITRNGRACISAWLNELPDQLLGMLRVLNHPIGDVCRDGVRSMTRARIFGECLDAMRQPR